MEISSKFVGLTFKTYQTKIKWRDTMNYAAAINDSNARYFDDEDPSGIIAPPMYSVALTWPILNNLQTFIDADDFPFEILKTQVHFNEYLEFHSPLIPDDDLLITGTIVAVLPKKSGTLIVIKFEAINQHQKMIFTEWIGGLMRGVICQDEGAGKEVLPHTYSFSKENNLEWEHVKQINKMAPFIYDAGANISFPIHTSKKFAHQVGLPDIILQGTATLAFAVRELLNRNADADPNRLKILSCDFSGMVFAPSEIRIQLLECVENELHNDLFFQVTDTTGDIVVKNGYARIER